MSALSEEIANDTLVRGYSGMTDAQVADSLVNTIDRPITKQFLSGSDIFNATDDAEYAALTAVEQTSWDALCGIDSIDTLSGVAKSREAAIFGPGTQTRTNLLAIRSSTVSRAEELGLGSVNEGDVKQARV